MCGIAGLVGNDPSRRVGEDTAAHLSHRGPEAHATLRRQGQGWVWEFVHTRLSIVDLSPAGEQPIGNEDETLFLSFNGEIYNYPELRRECEARGHRFSSSMDGEVILHLWEDEGPRALARLNGIFAIAIGNTTTGEVTLARDPLGVKPLFYRADGDNCLWFASELRALATTGASLGKPDVVALAQFLSFLWIPDPRTPYSDAKSLEPGQAISWSRDGVRKFPYAEPFVSNDELDIDDVDAALEEAGARFREATRRQLMADVPIGLMASGGVDSGLIWWAAGEGLARAFTIEWPERSGSEKLQEDVDAVRVLERRFGTPVDYLPGDRAGSQPLPPSGDLFADPAYELTRLIACEARDRGFKVLLSGQGGDELFGGYRRHATAPLMHMVRVGGLGRLVARGLQHVPARGLSTEYAARVLGAMAQPDDFSAYMHLCTYSTAQERAEVLGCTEAEVSDEIVWQRHREVFDALPSRLSFFRKVLALDLAVYMPGLGLSYVDRAGMEFSVEIRVPWLDLEFVRWSLRLPESLLVKRGRGKWLTRELAARKLSSELGHRPKRAFAAPAERLDPGRDGTGQRGFRQGIQFARARQILELFLDESPLLKHAAAP